MFASLPMYDRASNVASHDAFWRLLRDELHAQGIPAPDTLNRAVEHMTGWGRSDLVLGQICNLPYRAIFSGRVTLIGAADYGLDDCPAGHYRSVIIAHKDAPNQPLTKYATARFAANALGSHSGYGAPQEWAQSHGFLLPSPILTGSHDASLRYVAEGRADIAALDAQTWALQQRDMPQANQVRIIAHTKTSPGMSFITRLGMDPAPFRMAISQAIAQLDPVDANNLGLKGCIDLPAADYNLPMPPLPQGLSTE